MSTSGIEKLGVAKPISPKDKISRKRESNDSSPGTGRISDTANISSKGKKINEMFTVLNSVKNHLEANPKVAGRLHKNFNLNSLGNLIGNSSLDIENVLKGITQEIKSNMNAAVNAHNNMNVAEVAKFIPM